MVSNYENTVWGGGSVIPTRWISLSKALWRISDAFVEGPDDDATDCDNINMNVAATMMIMWWFWYLD